MEWIILILGSAIFLALRTILSKEILLKNNTLPLLFLVSFFSTFFMIIFHNHIQISLNINTYFLIFLKSAIIAISWFCLYNAYKHLEISVVAPLENLSPVFLIILSFIFLSEKASAINYVGIFILITTAYMLQTGSFSKIFKPVHFFKSKYFLLILVALIGFSISAVLDKIILKFTNYYNLLFFFFLFMSIIYLAIITVKKEISSLKPFLYGNNILRLFFIIISSLLSDFFYFMAVSIPKTLVILLIPLRRLSTLVSTLIGGKLFHEENILYKSIICLIMIFGVFLVIL